MGDAAPAQRDMPADEVDDVRWKVLHDLRGGVKRKGFPGPDAARRKGVQNGRPNDDQQDREERVGSARKDETGPQPGIPAQLAERGVFEHDATGEDQPEQGQTDSDRLQRVAPIGMARYEPSGLRPKSTIAPNGAGRSVRRNAEIMPPPRIAPVTVRHSIEPVGAMMSGVPKDFAHMDGRRPAPA